MKPLRHFPHVTGQTRFTLYLLALVLLALPGCKGCRDTKTLTKSELDEKLAEEKKKKKEEEKEPFEWGRVYSLPNDMERVDTRFKPGHWTEFTAELWANQADFSGELVTDPFKMTPPWSPKLTPGERQRKVEEVVPFRLGTSRPALLPKQQKKHLGMVLFVPPGDSGRNIHYRLTPRGSTRSVKEQLITANRLHSWCFNFLVLSSNPNDYRALFNSALDSIRPGAQAGRGGLASDPAGLGQPYYHMRIPKLDRYVPISENALAWTSTAYVLWDGIDPALLTEDQQRAMIDWLHWGGQVIVSGPDSMDLLKDSFLSPYLPATAEADITLTKDDFKTFNENWTNQEVAHRGFFGEERPPASKPKAKAWKPRPLNIVQPWSGKKLKVVEDTGVEVLAKSDRADGAPLVVDRRVGLGRIALTAFRLNQKELRLSAWPSFDAFVNGCLLRHPPREFAEGSRIMAVWRDPQGTYRAGEGRDPDNDPTFMRRAMDSLQPELISRVRYFTRDATLSAAAQQALVAAEGLEKGHELDDKREYSIDDRDTPPADENSAGFEETPRPQSYRYGSGVAGWNDFNHPSQLARHALTDASGIVIPRANKVVALLAIYLAVLVPLNWLVFRIINRVEWAWIAAPLITIACTVVVIRYAELDIGFARSRSEVAVLEIQGEYPRAHVTRYTGVYTSLATSYDVEFSDPSSVIQPYASHSRAELVDENHPIFSLGSSTVQFRRDDKQIALTGFEVSSNSTGMLHAEHMLDVGGGIAARHMQGNDYELVNRTKLDLKGAAVVNREGMGWIGDLAAGVKKTVTLASRPNAQTAQSKRPSAVADQVQETRRAIAEQEARLIELEEAFGQKFRKEPITEVPKVKQVQQEIDRLKGVLANLESGSFSTGDWFAERESDPITARARREDVLKARLLVRLAESADTLADGELRLVAWTSSELPGMEITPRASQARFANLVVAHLHYDGQLKHAKWTLSYRNDDYGSREQLVSRRPPDDLGGPRMPDGELSDLPDDPAAAAARFGRFIKRHDKNNDGVLERSEWPSDTLYTFEEIDADGNGKITAAELEAFLRKLDFSSP